MVVNTIFLVRELRRSEQHDSFINAVTHELKTPVASIRLHLETLQRRDLPEARKQEFYKIMLSDADRLTETVEQVLRAGRAGDKRAGREKAEVDFGQLVQDCLEAIRTRHHLPPEAMRYEQALNNGNGVRVLGSPEDLRTAVSNVLENAVKYSGDHIDVAVRLETPDEKRVLLEGERPKASASPRGSQANLQALSSRRGPLAGSHQGNRAGPVHCEFHCQKAWRQSLRAERGRGARERR